MILLRLYIFFVLYTRPAVESNTTVKCQIGNSTRHSDLNFYDDAQWIRKISQPSSYLQCLNECCLTDDCDGVTIVQNQSEKATNDHCILFHCNGPCRPMPVHENHLVTLLQHLKPGSLGQTDPIANGSDQLFQMNGTRSTVKNENGSWKNHFIAASSSISTHVARKEETTDLDIVFPGKSAKPLLNPRPKSPPNNYSNKARPQALENGLRKSLKADKNPQQESSFKSLSLPDNLTNRYDNTDDSVTRKLEPPRRVNANLTQEKRGELNSNSQPGESTANSNLQENGSKSNKNVEEKRNKSSQDDKIKARSDLHDSQASGNLRETVFTDVDSQEQISKSNWSLHNSSKANQSSQGTQLKANILQERKSKTNANLRKIGSKPDKGSQRAESKRNSNSLENASKDNRNPQDDKFKTEITLQGQESRTNGYLREISVPATSTESIINSTIPKSHPGNHVSLVKELTTTSTQPASNPLSGDHHRLHGYEENAAKLREHYSNAKRDGGSLLTKPNDKLLKLVILLYTISILV